MRDAQRDLAKAMGINAGMLSSWQGGRSCPVARFRIVLWKRLGIPIEAWDEPAPLAAASHPEPQATGTEGK